MEIIEAPITSADDYMAGEANRAALKQQIIEGLIAQRDGAIADLAKMGYKKPRVRSTPKPTAKKRGRPVGSRNAAKSPEAAPEATA